MLPHVAKLPDVANVVRVSRALQMKHEPQINVVRVFRPAEKMYHKNG